MPKKKFEPLAIEFVTSAAQMDQYPLGDRPEIALAGRSNAGKSSLLNALAGKKVAFVSQEPGKTRIINFFNVGKKYRFVDLPGYGWSARPGDEMLTWEKMIETYFSTRGTLRGVCLLLDCRRQWDDEERLITKFFKRIGLPFFVVHTKIDKLNQKELFALKSKKIKDIPQEDRFFVSSEDLEGLSELEDSMFKRWVRK